MLVRTKGRVLARGAVVLALSWAGVAALGFYWGRCGALARVTAAQPASAPAQAAAPVTPPVAPTAAGDYAREVIAYIYDVIPITRADLGEFLIARWGADRLEVLVNERIIEHAC